jgi:aspartate aminotransferase
MTVTETQTLSKLVLEMQESATIKMAQMSRDLKAKGLDVIDLSLGEPDFDTPVHIKEEAKRALDAGFTKYTPVPGTVDLRKAISEKFKRENGLDYGINQIVVSNGAKQAIANIALALLDEGDEVVLFAPYWVSYYEIIKMAKGVPVPVYAGVEHDFKVTAEQVAAAITPRTKFVLFSSPCNPTGSVYNREELKAIAEAVAPHEHVYIISDEIYEYINFMEHHVSIGSFPEIKDRTITVNGFSKGYAMTGWRLGYIGAPTFIAQAVAKIQGQFTSGANSFGQKAATLALTSDMSATYEMRKAFIQRRDTCRELLTKIPGFKVNNPDGAFYFFPDISYYFGKSYDGQVINNPDDFCEFLLQYGHVGCVSGMAFGDDNCFRISYATSDDILKIAIERITKTVALLT